MIVEPEPQRRRDKKEVVAAVMLLLPALVSAAADLPKAPVPKSPYLPIVYRYADTMLERGRDTYGPQKTGLFLSALDRSTLASLTNRPGAPSGVRQEVRVGAPTGPFAGANLQHDENLLRLLYTLSELSAKPKYRAAADSALKWFLENARSPSPDLLPWGENMSWDVLKDEPVASGPSRGIHEFFRPWLLWDRCFDLAPEASKHFALGLWQPVAEQRATAFDRQVGFHIRTWAVAWARTKDDQFVKAIGALLDRLEKRREGKTTSALSLAIDCDGAAHHAPEPLASRLRALAAGEDEVFCALGHNLKNTGGFLTSARTAAGPSRDQRTLPWKAGSGNATTAQVGMMCVSRYDNTGKVAYRDLILAAAGAYLNSVPADSEDTWPAALGQAISLQVAAWRHSANPAYLERARTFADFAVEKFWGTNALPRASVQSEHYETITGADTLALALVELHLQILHITAVRCPPNTIDR
jgi:hypothetical protein